MTVDFKVLLAKPVDDIKRPPAAPAGTYYGTLSKYKFDESRFGDRDSGEKHAVAVVSIINVRPGEDVDVAQIPEDFNKRPFSVELPLSGGYEWTTKQLAEDLGIATQGRGFGEIVPELVNHEVMFSLTQRADKNNPSVMYNDVRSVRAVPVQASTQQVA